MQPDPKHDPMEITRSNYFQQTAGYDWESIPETLRKGHEFLTRLTNDGASWNAVSGSPNIGKVVSTHLQAMNRLASGKFNFETDSAPKTKEKTPDAGTKPRKKATGAPKRKKAGKEGESKKRTAKPKPSPKADSLPTHVPEMGTELKLIRRFKNLHDKPKTYKQVLAVYAAVNRAIAKGEVRKSPPASKYWEDIAWIQEKLHYALKNAYLTDDVEEKQTLKFEQARIDAFHKLTSGFRVWNSVRLAVRFAGMQGKFPDEKPAKSLLDAIDRELEKPGKRSKKDKVAAFLPKIKKALEEYLQKMVAPLQLESQTLSGLSGALSGCGCEHGNPRSIEEHLPLSGFLPRGNPMPGPNFHRPSSPSVAPETDDYIIPPRRGGGSRHRSDRMPSNPGRNLIFTGRWAGLFSQPARGFSAMVWGLPKSGKSTLAIDFGGYLAENFGKVLYAAIEEGDDQTIRQRIERLGVGHPDMVVADHLPAGLSRWDFVIVDSASEGLMSEDTMRRLITDFPDTSFIFLFHATNRGLPRGGTVYRHIVDVLVEVSEGHANAAGRFGPGQMPVRFN